MEPKPTIMWERHGNKQYLMTSDERRHAPYSYIVDELEGVFYAYVDYDMYGSDNIASSTDEEEAKAACIKAYFKEVYG